MVTPITLWAFELVTDERKAPQETAGTGKKRSRGAGGEQKNKKRSRTDKDISLHSQTQAQSNDLVLNATQASKDQPVIPELGKINMQTIPFNLLREMSAAGYTIPDGNDLRFDHRNVPAPFLVRVFPFLVHSAG
jgi:hypothetical protein